MHPHYHTRCRPPNNTHSYHPHHLLRYDTPYSTYPPYTTYFLTYFVTPLFSLITDIPPELLPQLPAAPLHLQQFPHLHHRFLPSPPPPPLDSLPRFPPIVRRIDHPIPHSPLPTPPPRPTHFPPPKHHLQYLQHYHQHQNLLLLPPLPPQLHLPSQRLLPSQQHHPGSRQVGTYDAMGSLAYYQYHIDNLTASTTNIICIT